VHSIDPDVGDPQIMIDGRIRRIDRVEFRGGVVGRAGPWSPLPGWYGAAVVISATRHSASGFSGG
jgi:hypothetical protein